MATLVKRKPRTFIELLWPPGSGSIVRGTLRRVIAVVIVMTIGGLTASATMVGGYLIYSGILTTWLAQILAAACTSLGQCSNFPAMLSALAGGVVVIALMIMGILAPMLVKDEPEEPRSAEMSRATLLLNWYCLSDKSREMLLKLLETSDAEVSEGVVYMLREEHRAIQEVMRDGG